MSKNAGTIRIDLGKFAQMLGLPKGHNVYWIGRPNDAHAWNKVDLVVTGPLMPEVVEGSMAPVVMPEYAEDGTITGFRVE